MGLLSRRRRWALAVLLLLAITAGLAACGGSDNSNTTGSTTKAASGPTTITWWDYFGYSPEGNNAINGMIAAYEKSHPGVKIKRTSYAYPDFFTKFNQTVATNHTPDIAAMDAGQIPSYAAQGALQDMTKYVSNWPVKSQFFPQVLDQVTVQDKTYGVPFRSNSIVLWYNKDLFKQAGISTPPQTWDELRADAKKLTNGQHSGICFPATKDEVGAFMFESFLWQSGSDLQKIGDPASVNALNYVNTLVNVDKSAPKSVLQWSWDDIAAQFTSGKCATMMNGPWVYGAVDSGKKVKNWGVAKLPTGPAGGSAPLGGEAWVIGKSAKNPDAVWKLIQWLSDNNNSFKPIMSGLQSFIVRKDQQGLAGADWSSIVPVVSEQVKIARARSAYGTNYNQISTAVQNMEQAVLTGQTPAKDAASQASGQIKPLLPQG
ncbi:MAG TPA: sugar ABC transporter substrate-binding protein [Solirubrobacteraceae bacterium]|jgi:multiple sugar transport system substrate-binding protein|nr:sugar ABC transporter substrate-binding protein [Solirubrobacteraceae bacterium]